MAELHDLDDSKKACQAQPSLTYLASDSDPREQNHYDVSSKIHQKSSYDKGRCVKTMK